jgi:hypothetical protein
MHIHLRLIQLNGKRSIIWPLDKVWWLSGCWREGGRRRRLELCPVQRLSVHRWGMLDLQLVWVVILWFGLLLIQFPYMYVHAAAIPVETEFHEISWTFDGFFFSWKKKFHDISRNFHDMWKIYDFIEWFSPGQWAQLTSRKTTGQYPLTKYQVNF